MLTYALIGLAVLIAGFIIFVAMQPATFRISRSATINASPSAVFPHINNLHNMEVWSPWEKMDPEMQRTYEGPVAGPGAIYRWSGNKQIGEGSMTIIESRPDEFVGIKLNFIRPFQCSNDVDFILIPKNNETVVTWSMAGHNKFMNKAVCLFMNMDKMCGGQFEKGLADLKAIVEGTAPASGAGVVATLPSPELTT